MTGSLFSSMWYRVARLKPRLRANVRVQRQRYRGQDWYLLIDEASERVFRVDGAAYAFVGRCDGRHTAETVWDQLATERGDALPEQDALLRLMLRLDEAGLLSFDQRPDIGSVFERHQRVNRKRLMGKLNPLSFRVRLGDPSSILRALGGLGSHLFQPASLWLWLAAVAAAALAALLALDGLLAHAARLMQGTDVLWLMCCVYPPVKLVHELAHGLAVRRWGGEVKEWGISMLVLMPVPYVDASAATSFRQPYQRVMVSAAGILAELLLAALALGVWLAVEPGLTRDLALTVMFVASVSTLLVNGNPLLRFDGYYVLTDAFELPNLATRSRQWWIDKLRTHLLGMTEREDMDEARGERAWLIAYQPLSWVYRVGLSAGIAWWLGERVPVFGYLAALWFAWQLVLGPLVATLRSLLDARQPEASRGRARLLALLLAVVLPVGVFGLRLPAVTLAEGVVWVPDEAQVRAGSAGFVTRMALADGATVKAGDVILTLADDRLMAQRAQVARELEGLETELYDRLRADSVGAAAVSQRIARAQHALVRVDEQIDGLTVRATRDGRLVIPREADLPGRFVPRGEMLGLVLNDQPLQVRVALPHADAGILGRLDGVEARLVDTPAEAFRAELIGQVPAAGTLLPAAALGAPAGGHLAVDPAEADGLRTLEPVVWVDVRLPDVVRDLSGGRALVRFDHGAESIAVQSWRRVRQLLLSRLDPEGSTWLP